ncbi:MAG: ribonuclease Z [Spirochaetales bacterium]|nr:ribonuclease Z [Spirochaetales bacterium]
MTLEAFVLGTGGMMPLPGRGLTSVLLRREGSLFLFDCGEGTQVNLRRLNLKWKKISVIFISHTHADHITGLPGILMLSSQVERQEPLYIFGPPRVKEYVEATCRILEIYINYEIIVTEITSPGIIYSEDDFEVRAFSLYHSRPCMGYALEEKMRPGIFFPEKALALEVPQGPQWSQLQNGQSVENQKGKLIEPSEVMGPARKGRKFSFVTDTAYKPAIADEVQGSDLLICEAMFTQDMEEDAKDKKHLTSLQSAEIAKAAEVKSMGMIHYSPRYTRRDLYQIAEEAKSVFPDAFLTKDCQHIPIPYEE